jgi:hypothetical protein
VLSRPIILLVALSIPAQAQEPFGLLLQGEAAESFLKTARVVKRKAIGVGVTHPYQLTLDDGTRTLKAAWKTIDESPSGVKQFVDGKFEANFRDSYMFEIAVYELDKLLGLGLVPPTVEREINNENGSVQLWVEGSLTEWERRKQNLKPPDVERWNEQMFKVRLLHQLTYNTDYTNIRNILVDPDFRIYAIDFSRAFRLHDALLAEADLTRFSRSALARLRGLDRPLLEQKLDRWLTRWEMEGLLKRRDRILALAERRLAEQGEDAALYP